jgi:hypothetical protein
MHHPPVRGLQLLQQQLLLGCLVVVMIRLTSTSQVQQRQRE